MLLMMIALQTTVTLAPADLQDAEKAGAVCRAAYEASSASDDAEEWLNVISKASSNGGLSASDHAMLFRLCSMYAVATRDAASKRLVELGRELDRNRREGLEALTREGRQ